LYIHVINIIFILSFFARLFF